MNKNYLFVATFALLIGILGTNLYYTNAQSESMAMNKMGGSSSMDGGHMMPDGTMMGGNMQNGKGGNTAGNMDSMMMDMLANMKGKSGVELEKAFLTDMVPHHQGAVDMAKLLLQDKTVRPELVKFANAIIAAQDAEIKQMQIWISQY